MRINKFIAESGVASRREADRMVTEGRVKINGKPVTQPGTDVDVYNDAVYVDGVRIDPVRRDIYIMLNKPKGCITSVKDDKGRKTVMDYVDCGKRIFPVGRLDYDSEGLVLMTNDGDLAYNLTASKNDVPKTYIAKAEGEVKEEHLKKLRSGILLDGVMTKPASSRAVRMAVTRPSIMSEGATMSAPAWAWLTAVRARMSRLGSLRITPSGASMPQ